MNPAHLSPDHQPNQCGICYETYVLNSAVFLPCFHDVCYDCFGKLVKPICPFCRLDFSNELNRSEQDSFYAPATTESVLQNRYHNSSSHINIQIDQHLDYWDNRLDRQSARRQRWLRRYRNKQRRLHRNQLESASAPFYDFFVIFQNNSPGSFDQENQPPVNQTNKKSHQKEKQINRRLDRKPRSGLRQTNSILSVR